MNISNTSHAPRSRLVLSRETLRRLTLTPPPEEPVPSLVKNTCCMCFPVSSTDPDKEKANEQCPRA
jgi:hypothetical protein